MIQVLGEKGTTSKAMRLRNITYKTNKHNEALKKHQIKNTEQQKIQQITNRPFGL